MRKILLLLLLCISLLLCNGCTQTSSSQKFSKDYVTGVITTTEKKKDSNIKYFDENLDIVFEENIQYPSLGDTFYQPTYIENMMYLVPNGLYGENNEKKILKMNLDSGEKQEYSVDKINILNVAVNNKYFYTLSNLNNIEYLTQLDVNGNIIKDISDNNNIMTMVVCLKDKVCLFKSNGTEGTSIQSYIEIYDTQLNLLKTLDISHSAKNHLKYAINDNLLFFSNDFNDGEKSSIGILNIDNYDIQFVELKTPKPSDLVIYNNYLYIAQSDITIPDGKKISIMNLNDYKDIKEYDIQQTIARMEIYKDKIYILSSLDEDAVLSKYNAETLTEEKNVKIDINRDTPYYPSVLFTKNK